MTTKAIKQVMKTWFKEIENGDESYNKLYEAIYTLHSAGLIENKQFNDLIEYDEKLYNEYTGL